MLSKDRFVEDPQVRTLYESFESAVHQFGGRKCLGWRPIRDGKAGDFEWYTYKQAHGACAAPHLQAVLPMKLLAGLSHACCR